MSCKSTWRTSPGSRAPARERPASSRPSKACATSSSTRNPPCLEAAIAAGVPRFIPSDYSTDFTKFPDGQNRNLDLRRAFHARLDKAPIAATSVLNGAFTYLLTHVPVIVDRQGRQILYWEDADQKLDFTSMADTATFTAAAALDAAAPRILRIAGSEISARELAALAGELTKAEFALVRLGSLDDLAARIRRDRAADPASESQVFPIWQHGQYLYGMFSGLGKLAPLDNDRYPGMHWTTARDALARVSGQG